MMFYCNKFHNPQIMLFCDFDVENKILMYTHLDSTGIRNVLEIVILQRLCSYLGIMLSI